MTATDYDEIGRTVDRLIRALTVQNAALRLVNERLKALHGRIAELEARQPGATH